MLRQVTTHHLVNGLADSALELLDIASEVHDVERLEVRDVGLLLAYKMTSSELLSEVA